MAADSSYCYFKDLERVAVDHQIDLNSASGMREATAFQAAEDRRLADQTLTGLGVMTAPAAALGSIRAATSLYFRNPEALAIYGGEAGLFAGALISGADTPLSMPAAAIRQPVRAGVQYSQSAVEAAQRGNAGRVLAEASEMPLASGSMTGVVTEAVSAPNVVPKSDTKVAWPPNRGFDGDPAPATLIPGATVDRYGSPNGTFFAPDGTPFPMWALPESSAAKPLNTYEVLEPIEVNAGPAAPWFNQPGGGLQFELSRTVQELIDSGHLR